MFLTIFFIIFFSRISTLTAGICSEWEKHLLDTREPVSHGVEIVERMEKDLGQAVKFLAGLTIPINFIAGFFADLKRTLEHDGMENE